MQEDDRETIIVLSGGGSRGFWQWLVLLLIARKFKIAMICGSSAGALNAYGFGKGLLEFVTQTWGEVFQTNAAPITKPGLAEIKDGKLHFNLDNIKKHLLKGVGLSDIPKLFFKSGQAKILKRILDNVLTSPTLLDNAPLYDRIREMQKAEPGWKIPTFWNRVDMQTGRLDACSFDDKVDPETEVFSVVSSSTIPFVWPLVGGRYADGGLREGTPLKQIFDRLDPKIKYRLVMLECTRDEMPDNASLANPLDVASQVYAITSNESRRNDVSDILARNEEAKEKGEAAGRLYIPVYRLRYPGDIGALDFSEAAYMSMSEDAQKSFSLFSQAYDSEITI